MYVEDLLIKIRNTLMISDKKAQSCFGSLLSDEWHRSFISNIGRYIDANKSLSTKQSNTILKLIGKVLPYLIKNGWITDLDLNQMLTEPQFRHPLYESTNVPKEVRHIGDNLLAFRCKNSDVVRNKIKALGYPRLTESRPAITDSSVMGVLPVRFDWLYKVWIVRVHRFNVADVHALIETERFNVDHATAHYLHLVRHSFNQPSLFAVADDIIVGNVCDDAILAGWVTEVAGGVTL